VVGVTAKDKEREERLAAALRENLQRRKAQARKVREGNRTGPIDAPAHRGHAAQMRFVSDNAAAAHPKVIAAIAASNCLDAPYDDDAWSARLDGAFSELFETDVRAFWVTTGTAANCLALAALCPPYRGIICHKDAHIEVDEAGAPGFFTGGAKLMLLEGPGAKVTPETVATACDRIRKDVHQVQPAVLSITNATEYGLVYRAAQIAELGKFARERGLNFHMDGARLANALATTGESPADVTWRAGVDALSFGFVKNGGLNAEALILFRTELADEIAVRRKRAGHLLSKGRMLAAQLLAMLDGDLWLENARGANAAAQILAKAAPDRLVYPVDANEIFLKVTIEEAARLRADGFDFYDWGAGEIRLVTSWDHDAQAVERLAAAIAAL
jgi:threonine aldolase